MRRPLRLHLSRRLTTITVLAIGALAIAAGAVLAHDGHWFTSDNPWPYQAPTRAPVLAAVGDISCQPGSPVEAEAKTDTCDLGIHLTARDAAQNATAEQVEAMKPNLVAVLGEQYQNGYYSDFENSFDR